MAKQKPIKQWPTDWPDRVAVEPVEEYLAQKGKTLTEEQRHLLELIRDEAKRQKLPPYISISLRKMLSKIAKPDHILHLMGIPNLKKTSLLKQKKVWAAERREQGLPSLGRIVPGWQNQYLAEVLGPPHKNNKPPVAAEEAAPTVEPVVEAKVEEPKKDPVVRYVPPQNIK